MCVCVCVQIYIHYTHTYTDMRGAAVELHLRVLVPFPTEGGGVAWGADVEEFVAISGAQDIGEVAAVMCM